MNYTTKCLVYPLYLRNVMGHNKMFCLRFCSIEVIEISKSLIVLVVRSIASLVFYTSFSSPVDCIKGEAIHLPLSLLPVKVRWFVRLLIPK